MAYLIYWIHQQHHKDPYKEGYIGITNNLTRRLSQHKKHNENPIVSNKFDSSVVTILKSDLTKECALSLEEEYRPDVDIGWNINKGGYMPPSQKGRTYETQQLKGSNRTEKQKQASLNHSILMKERAKELRSGDHLPSQKGRKRSEESKQLYRKAALNRPVLICPHCEKSGKGPVMRKWHFVNCKFKV